MSVPHSEQQKLWAKAKAQLEQEPTAEDYAGVYNEINSFLRDYGDADKGRSPDGTIYGVTGAVDEWEKRIIVALAGEPGKEVMEMGCGDGRMSLAMAARGAIVKATDISEVAIAAAKKQLAARPAAVTFALGNALSLDEPSSHYDYAVSCDMVEHLHPKQVPTHLREVFRILKPGAAYVVSVPLWAPPGQEDPLHLGNYHRADFLALLTGAGFQPESAPEVLFNRTRDLNTVFGPPRTFSNKIIRGVSRFPVLNGIIGQRALRRWWAHKNFFFARKP